MRSQELRRQFLQYFKRNGHSVIPSSLVVPHEDPTLLFTNAGMNQFKDVFLGKSSRDFTRAATSQKCIRGGGKHNDLENVGHTRRHLTFFEMLGNFSFGDYFKKEAIRYAWEVVTEVLQLDPRHVWASVFREDDEAFELWTSFLPAERIVRLGEKDNFWAMGDTGPCGPCSELLYDRGPEYGEAPSPLEDSTGERFLEFWNLVFMQYNTQPDGTRLLLPKPSIDTGAGLERVLSLKINADNVFETDVLRELIAEVENISGKSYQCHEMAPAFRVIADHLRCLSFAISDGAQPSNVDRGYVLRKVLRRAVRYGRSLGLQDPFLAKLLPRLVKTMGEDYPELHKNEERIAEILTLEEEAFIRTLKRGGNLLNQIIEHAQEQGNHISGDEAFKLKDTYGFPIEEIVLLAKDAGLVVDLKRFEEQEEQAKERSRQSRKEITQVAKENLFDSFPPTEFVGYAETEAQATIKALIKEGEFVDSLSEGEEGWIILDRTPFYAEMGGQVGDSGELKKTTGNFTVKDTKCPFKGIHAHIGSVLTGTFLKGEVVAAVVNKDRRQKIANNHTATHLLHYVLHQVLGEHIKQAGSLVEEGRLRFDFNHHKPLSPREIEQIEELVNYYIRLNTSINAYEISYEDAQKRIDIKQFFGDKYGRMVRVVEANNVSKELCGGTHTSATGNIGLFRISQEGSIAAGIRRIVAFTGEDAECYIRSKETLLDELSSLLKTTSDKVKGRLEKLLEETKMTEQQLKKVQGEKRKELLHRLLKQTEDIKGICFIAELIDCEAGEAKQLADEAIASLTSGIIAFGTNQGQLFIRVSEDLVRQGIHANVLINQVAPLIGGSGGGKPQAAQAGGKSGEKMKDALEELKTLIYKR